MRQLINEDLDLVHRLIERRPPLGSRSDANDDEAALAHDILKLFLEDLQRHTIS